MYFCIVIDIYLDISVESGVFPRCDFEADTSQWKDISVGQFVWQRDQNGTVTANTGPSVDHTTGTEMGKNIRMFSSIEKRTNTESYIQYRHILNSVYMLLLGWYMTVEASHGDQNSYAALQSTGMKDASNECLFEFYYHMFGEGKHRFFLSLKCWVRQYLTLNSTSRKPQ